MILILALGVSALIVIPIGLLAALGRFVYTFLHGRRLDRSGGAR